LLKNNPTLAITLHNVIYSPINKKFYKKLSRNRALAVKDILVKKGIKEERIAVTGVRKAKLKKTKEPVPAVQFPHQQIELEITDIK
jgi:hypothetical protein